MAVRFRVQPAARPVSGEKEGGRSMHMYESLLEENASILNKGLYSFRQRINYTRKYGTGIEELYENFPKFRPNY